MPPQPEPAYPPGFLQLEIPDQYLQAGQRAEIRVSVHCAEGHRGRYSGAAGMEQAEREVNCLVVNVVDSYYHNEMRLEILHALTERPRSVSGKSIYAVEGAGYGSRAPIVSYLVAVGGRRHGRMANGGSWAELEIEVIDNAGGQVRARLAPFRIETSLTRTGRSGTTVVDGGAAPEHRLMRAKAEEALRLLDRVVGEGHQAASDPTRLDFSQLEVELRKTPALGTVQPARQRLDREGRCSFTLHASNPGVRGDQRNRTEGTVAAAAYHGSRLVYTSQQLPVAVLGTR